MRDRGGGQEERHRREPENPLRHASPPMWFVCGTPTVRSAILMRQQACQGLQGRYLRYSAVRGLDRACNAYTRSCSSYLVRPFVARLWQGCAHRRPSWGQGPHRAAGRRERLRQRGREGKPMAKLTRDDVLKKAEELKNWGKWGPDDELGVLNYVTPEDIVNAARLVKKGKVFRLGLNLDENGPQRGIFGGRWNPMHQMLATGTDAVAGKHDVTPGLRYADDAINLPTQAATQWDALAHVFLGEKMWNGYPATLVDSRGAHKNGIENFASKMVGRGVLLDVARCKGVPFLADGYGITVADLDGTARAQGVTVRRADFVIVRTGQMEDRLARDDWGGYAGGDAPGLAFETLDWIHGKQIAAICSDTWGIEVRPNASGPDVFQPWHWVTIPAIGIVHGEIFYLKELAEDCAADRVYEFFLCAPPLVITRGTGSPINPQAIK